MSYLQESERRELVRSQISRVPNVKMKTDMAMIPCPFHADKNPSCGVYFRQGQKNTGSWFCFGCNKHGLWDELADTLGLEKFNSKPEDKFSRPIKVEISDVDEISCEKLIFKKLPEHKVWRGISTNTLRAIGCRLCKVQYESSFSDTFIWMPVYINKELVGYIKARKQKADGKPSYINKKGTWAKSQGLFPFDYSINMALRNKSKSVVLVEGQRDALKLIEYGIPALCIMGTHNWNDDKSKLLDIAGIEKAIICMDGDDAGISGTRLIYPSLKKYLSKVSVVKLWNWEGSPYLKFANYRNPSKAAKEHSVELWDPFNCPIDVLDFLKELTK